MRKKYVIALTIKNVILEVKKTVNLSAQKNSGLSTKNNTNARNVPQRKVSAKGVSHYASKIILNGFLKSQAHFFNAIHNPKHVPKNKKKVIFFNKVPNDFFYIFFEYFAYRLILKFNFNSLLLLQIINEQQ